MLISHNLRRNAEGTRITLVYKVQLLCGPPSFLDGYNNMADNTDIRYCKHHKKHHTSVYDLWGEKGWWVGRGVAVKDASSGVGVIKRSFQKHLKTGGG